MLCDVIPMDICHMLLGRPWQFDKHAVHDGRANTYTLTKDGVKHKLKPLKETNEAICSATRVCVVHGRKFLDTRRCEHVCFSIVPKDEKAKVEEVPTEVVDLLKEFLDIVSDNVPNRLPPVWKINHQIDLIPRASFSNNIVHRMTLAESEELNRQVNELLQKGLIQESLSPCVVPVDSRQRRR